MPAITRPSSIRSPPPSPMWSMKMRRAAPAHHRFGAGLRSQVRPHQHRRRRPRDRVRAPAWPADRLAAGDPRPRRPSRPPLPAEAAGRRHRHRRRHPRRARRVQAHLQPGAGLRAGRLAVRPPVRRRRDLPHRRAGATAIHVPGHTPADMAYLVGDAAFVGDTLFMPDVGTARCDFPAATRASCTLHPAAAGPARRHAPVHVPRLSAGGREARWQTTVAEQRQANIHVRDGVSEDEFVAMRTRRDATLGMPTLILPAIQVNIRAGHFPPAEDNGVRYLKSRSTRSEPAPTAGARPDPASRALARGGDIPQDRPIDTPLSARRGPRHVRRSRSRPQPVQRSLRPSRRACASPC